jgi:enoyl-CoA hydratase/carnithine racemase
MTVRLVVEGAVATLTFDDAARRNVMTPELGDALAQHVGQLASMPFVRAVILTGAHGAFSSGGDLKMLESLRATPRDEARDFMLSFYRRYLSVLDLEVPVIAAVSGAAIGAGLCVALACDLLVVDSSAKLALNFAQLGLHPGMGATYLVQRRAGVARAFELLTTGRRFSGAEAAAWGLALEALPASEVLPRAEALAAAIASSAPAEVRALTQTLRPDPEALAAALLHEAQEQARSYASSDLAEGLRAAGERRTPQFADH